MDGDGNFVPVNTADNWLHLVFGAGLLGGWFISRSSTETTTRTDRPATTPQA